MYEHQGLQLLLSLAKQRLPFTFHISRAILFSSALGILFKLTICTHKHSQFNLLPYQIFTSLLGPETCTLPGLVSSGSATRRHGSRIR